MIHDSHLKSDILLLPELIEKNFRKNCLKFYKLNADHYLQVLV